VFFNFNGMPRSVLISDKTAKANEMQRPTSVNGAPSRLPP